MIYSTNLQKTSFNLSVNKLIISILFLFLSNLTWGQILSNGDMESWTNNTPDNWTTIDSGITTAQESTIIHGGTYSASIEVTTEAQANTDFMQSVTLISGHDYHVSVWIYHTEGNIKARLYVNGWRNYSNNSNTGLWQELTYNFTANSNGIDVGLRFYDQSSFDGSEIVYVDDFSITDQSTSTITTSPSSLTGRGFRSFRRTIF